MKHRIFTLTLVGAALIVFACGEDGPISPELSQSEEGATLAKSRNRKITEVAAISTICSVIPGEQSVADNILTVRGQVHSLIIESDDRRVNGTQSAVLNIVVDLATGAGIVWGTVTIEPDKVDGTWEGFFAAQGIGAFFAGNAVMHGTGDLEGQVLIVRIEEVPARPDPPCEIAEPAPGAPKTQTSASGFIAFLEDDDDDGDDDDDD